MKKIILPVIALAGLLTSESSCRKENVGPEDEYNEAWENYADTVQLSTFGDPCVFKDELEWKADKSALINKIKQGVLDRLDLNQMYNKVEVNVNSIKQVHKHDDVSKVYFLVDITEDYYNLNANGQRDQNAEYPFLYQYEMYSCDGTFFDESESVELSEFVGSESELETARENMLEYFLESTIGY